MMIYLYVYEMVVALVLFGLGASLTSFMIALIYRLESGVPYPEIIIKGSHCEECKKELRWFELIPVLSYLLFRGRCSRCGYKISATYPIFELLLGLVFAYFYLNGNPLPDYFIATSLYFLALYDFYHQGFPKAVMHLFLACALVYASLTLLFEFDIEKLYAVVISLIIGILIVLLNKVKESFGTGDILVFIFLGLLIKVESLVTTLILSIFIGAIGGVFLILINKASRKSRIPFVPFIWTAYILSFFLTTYFNRFFATYLLLW